MLLIDNQMLVEARKGDRKAQYQLYRSCYSVLMGVCVRYCHNEDDAAALMNSGFLKILNGLDKYREEVPFEAWIRRIMINTAIDDYRAASKEREHMSYTDFSDERSLAENDVYSHYQSDSIFSVQQLEQFIRALSPVTQRVFNLFAVDGFSHEEIGKMLNISIGTSKWHLNHARTELKSMISKYNITI